MSPSSQAPGPLRVHPRNPRYFSPDGKRAVLLTGAHTWDNLVDMGRSDPPEPFDFPAYLDFLERHGHNFIRLWAWDSTRWDTRANAALGKDYVHFASPQPWRRMGPGKAPDGRLKFDLTAFDTAYFDRLRNRVATAGRRGIYVSVMLFEGWGLMHGNRRRGTDVGWAWRSHPFHPDNNINRLGVPADPDGLSGDVHRLSSPAAKAVQEAYVRKVVDTLNDLDNVLYEVINEGGEKAWDWWVVDLVHGAERALPRQHPVGITGHGAEDLASMLASPANWISPGSKDGYKDDPPAWEAKKVSLLDTDHVWGVGGDVPWVWKAVTRGHNPLFMDPYRGEILKATDEARWEPIRRAMGAARRVTERMDLALSVPRNDLASTGYCLSNPGRDILVFLPGGGPCTVKLPPGSYRCEWIAPVEGTVTGGGTVAATGGATSFRPPFAGDAALFLVPA